MGMGMQIRLLPEKKSVSIFLKNKNKLLQSNLFQEKYILQNPALHIFPYACQKH